MKRCALLCLGVLAACSCGGGDDEMSGTAGMTGGAGSPAVGAASFATTVMPLFEAACNCHRTEPILMAPFSLKTGEAYDNLVDQPSQGLPSMVFVKPGSLNDSYLWHKVNGTQLEVGGVGMIMPYTIPLSEDERAIIGRWIVAGAPP